MLLESVLGGSLFHSHVAHSLTNTFDLGSPGLQREPFLLPSVRLRYHPNLLLILTFLPQFFMVGTNSGASLAPQALFEPPLSLGWLPAPTSALSRVLARAPKTGCLRCGMARPQDHSGCPRNRWTTQAGTTRVLPWDPPPEQALPGDAELSRRGQRTERKKTNP